MSVSTILTSTRGFVRSISAIACSLSLAAMAATPVAVWDGDFTATQTGFTLNRSGNAISQDNSTITIDQAVGVKVDFTTGLSSAMTVMFKYSDLAFDAQKTLATSFCSGGDENRTGVYVASGGTINGIWNTADWAHPAQTLSASSGVLAFCYSKAGGTSLYSVGASSRSELFNESGLRAGGDAAINGCTIGGERAKSGATLLSAATGMKITGIAIFDGILTEAEMTGYFWPSETQTINVSANTSVSAINAQYDSTTYKAADVTVASNVTITVNEAFSANIRSVSSTGTITLSADPQPDPSYFAHVDFSGVQGALLRSWLTEPGVVGFNFYKNKGNVTTSALAAGGTWYCNGSDKTGTSTALFSDGLSVLSWNCANVYSQGGYYDSTGEEGSLLNGYLDDGALNGYGAEVILSGVPYTTYDVIIYCASDNNPADFKAKSVNGTTYTWDSAAGSVVEGSANWGKAALGIPVYGVNTLRIKNLTGALTIYGLARVGDETHRGGISAIQIMPPGTPDNIKYYKLTLNGSATTWSEGAWTLDGQEVDAPTSGYVEIVASASTALTVDQAVSLADLVVTGAVNAVVNVATNDTGSLFAIKTTVASGVFQQGSPAILGAATTIVVEDGATFDLNGQIVNGVNLFKLAGAGAGNWPWALTSSGGEFPLGTLREISLNGNTTIGGANRIRFGISGYSSHIAYNNFTLTKTGAGELLLCNGRSATGSVGTLDVAGGEVTFTEFTCIDGYEDVYAHTAVIVREGATIRNNTNRFIWMDSLNWLGGEVISTNPFAITNTFEGAGTTAKLRFASGAQVTLTGDLVITNSLELGSHGQNAGDLSLVKADGVDPVTVTVSGTFSSAGSVSVGAGVTLNLGTSRPTATFDVNDEATLSVRLLNEVDAPIVHVTGRPKNLILYDEAGDVVADPVVTYNSENGTIVISTVNVWTKVKNESFDDGGNWSTGALPSSGANAAVVVTETTGITVQNAYTLSKLGISGTGDMTFSGTGSITAQTLDFSETTGRVEYNLPTGSADVKSGSNTLILGGGSGTPTVAASQTLTLGPWGTADGSGLTNTYNTILQPAVGSTLLFSPGEGKSQKLAGFGGTNTGTTVGATNGTLVVDMAGGQQSAFFGKNSVRIDNGGIVSLEAQDTLGYSYDHNVTINNGGVLAVRVRDTLRRTVNFNGGRITIEGAHSSRGLDFYGLTMNVAENSSIDQLEAQSKVGMRRDTTVVNVNDGKTLAINANLYHQDSNAGLTVRAAEGQTNQNGVLQLNGFAEEPKQTFTGTVTVGEVNRAAIVDLNCEHENGTYVVNAASRFRGTGSVTGNGGVTLVASNSKLCGSLTVNNLTAASGGTYGDEWNAVAAKVATSYFADGTQTIENGSFAIGKDCVVTNAANAADTTDAAFSIKADGSLKLEKSVTVTGLTVADGGTITHVAASRHSVPTLNVAGDTSFAGTVNFVMDFGSASTPGGRTYTLMTGALPNLANVSVSDGRGEKRWKVFIDGGALKVSSSGDFAIRLR